VTAHFDSRLYPLIGANGALSAGYVVFQFAPDLVVAGAGVLLSGAGFGLLLSLIRSMITGVTDESLRGSLVSLAEAIGRVVSTVTPIAMGAWIGFASPQMDLASAVQIAGLAAAVVSSGGGVFASPRGERVTTGSTTRVRTSREQAPKRRRRSKPRVAS